MHTLWLETQPTETLLITCYRYTSRCTTDKVFIGVITFGIRLSFLAQRRIIRFWRIKFNHYHFSYRILHLLAIGLKTDFQRNKLKWLSVLNCNGSKNTTNTKIRLSSKRSRWRFVTSAWSQMKVSTESYCHHGSQPNWIKTNRTCVGESNHPMPGRLFLSIGYKWTIKRFRVDSYSMRWRINSMRCACFQMQNLQRKKQKCKQ